MDSVPIRNGRLIDIVDDAWREDDLPYDDILVPIDELPDPEADSADSHLTLKEQSQKWLDEKINIKDQLPKYLASEIKLLTTKCVILEAEKIAKKVLGALNILKQFGVHQCGHKEPVSGADCILSMIGKDNSNHYIIATQDRALQNILRKIPGSPLIYLHKKAPTLEKPSDLNYEISKVKKENCTVTESQDNTIKALKEASGLPTNESVEFRRRKKKQKGPNPLSCLKKKKKPAQPTQNVSITKAKNKVKKRVRVKLPSHVKDILKSKSS